MVVVRLIISRWLAHFGNAFLDKPRKWGGWNVPSGTTNSVQVGLTVGGEVKVDDDGHVLHVNTTGQKISGDQHSGRPRSESGHDLLTLSLGHIGVHEADCELLLVHLETKENI